MLPQLHTLPAVAVVVEAVGGVDEAGVRGSQVLEKDWKNNYMTGFKDKSWKHVPFPTGFQERIFRCLQICYKYKMDKISITKDNYWV